MGVSDCGRDRAPGRRVLMAPIDPIILYGLAAAVGACLGSFATFLGYRLPRGLPLMAVRSQCPACQALLGPRSLVPVLSWLWLKGRCRACGASISIRYPLAELGTALVVVAIAARYGPTLSAVTLAALTALLVTLVIADLELRVIPDATLVGAALLALPWRALTDQAWLEAGLLALAFGALAYGLRAAFTRLHGIEALGLGDVKLMAVAGLWVSLDAVPLFLTASGGLGVALGAWWQWATGQRQFPFGPALAAGWLVALIVGPV